MPTQRVELNPEHLREARQAAAARRFSADRPLFFADMNEKGLLLRVRGGKAEWILKHGGKTRTLGPLGPERGDLKPGEIRVIKDARELAQKVRALLRDGSDPKSFLSGTAAGSGKWTWETLVERYCDVYLSNPRVTSRGVLKRPSLATAAEARRYLTMQEAQPLFGRLLSELRPGDLEDVRDVCEKAGRMTASRQFVAYARGALSFARRKHARASGLEDARKWWLEVEKSDITIPAPRLRYPSLTELARVLYVAEKHRTIPGRKYSRKTSVTVLSAFWFIALTAQRVTAAVSLQKAHVLPWPQGSDGWKVAYFPAGVMKGSRPHSLPIPPRVALLFERAASSSPNSAFVFPATRGRAGKDAPLSRWSVATLIDRLRGRSADPTAGHEFDGPDLLEGVAEFSPHDLRRTFATVCGDLAVRGDAISAVLDHADLASGQVPVRTAEITRIAYDYSQRLELKRIAMEAWTNALFEAVEGEWRSNRPPLTRGVPPRPRPAYGSPQWGAWREMIEAHIKRLKASHFSPHSTWYQDLDRVRELESQIRVPFSVLNRNTTDLDGDES